MAESSCLTTKRKILFVGNADELTESVRAFLRDQFQVVEVRDPLSALTHLPEGDFSGLYIVPDQLGEVAEFTQLLQNERILENMPDGVALLDHENNVIWANGQLRQWAGVEEVAGQNFYSILHGPEILGPDFCPFHTALSTGRASSSTLRAEDSRYYQLHAAPVIEAGRSEPDHLIVTVRDVTAEMLQQQKLAAIHKAGMELADLKPEELAHMSFDERIELLKSNILHYTKDLLHFDVVEIRMLDAKTGRLEQLLAVGMEPAASERDLYAEPQNNGVTGFVAATGKSYLCEDTTEDPLYLPGAKDAKSSLTVPLILHDDVIGTFNVESPEPRAFYESDLQFLEIFSRDVAVALNTLELLVAEKASTAAESVEAIHTAVALPIDQILNEAVNVMERYIGHEPEVVERLENILRNARDIKQVIQKVGQKMAPIEAVPAHLQAEQRPLLYGRRVLVVDADDTVRSAAHALLERYGCEVETAHDARECLSMVRSCGAMAAYDITIADIRLPDLPGHKLMLKLKEIGDCSELILMTGFGYDPGHSIVKARQAGLKEVLYKPFRLDQLLSTVERVLASRSGEATLAEEEDVRPADD